VRLVSRLGLDARLHDFPRPHPTAIMAATPRRKHDCPTCS
jgi:hypothetical protein